MWTCTWMGSRLATINQSSPSSGNGSKTWTSDLLPAGEHNLRLVFASGNGGGLSFVSVNSMEVIGAPVVLGGGVHDNSEAGISYSGRWESMSGVVGPYGDSLQYSYYPGGSIQTAFSGRQIKLSWLAGEGAGVLEVYVDGAKVASIDQASPSWAWGKRWTSDLLPAGEHNLRFVFASGGFVSLDALEVVSDPVILDGGTADDAGAGFTYDGAWLTMTGVNGPTRGRCTTATGWGIARRCSLPGSRWS